MPMATVKSIKFNDTITILDDNSNVSYSNLNKSDIVSKPARKTVSAPPAKETLRVHREDGHGFISPAIETPVTIRVDTEPAK